MKRRSKSVITTFVYVYVMYISIRFVCIALLFFSSLFLFQRKSIVRNHIYMKKNQPLVLLYYNCNFMPDLFRVTIHLLYILGIYLQDHNRNIYRNEWNETFDGIVAWYGVIYSICMNMCAGVCWSVLECVLNTNELTMAKILCDMSYDKYMIYIATIQFGIIESQTHNWLINSIFDTSLCFFLSFVSFSPLLKRKSRIPSSHQTHRAPRLSAFRVLLLLWCLCVNFTVCACVRVINNSAKQQNQQKNITVSSQFKVKYTTIKRPYTMTSNCCWLFVSV